MANTIGWGKGTQNNTNGWGKYQNTIDAGSVYADSYAGETVLVGTSAAFSYSKSSFHQDEADPTPTITGTTGGTFSATPSGLSINTSTGTIDLDNSTIQSYTITYTVSGVSADQTLAVTASPFIANNFSMQFDGTNYVSAGNILNFERTDAFSISAWVKTNATSTQVIFNKLISNVGYQFFINSTGKLGFYAQQSASVYIQKNSTAAFNNNSWHHVVITYDGSSNRSGILLYANGNAAATTDVGSASLNATIVNSTDAIIGSSFIGNIDEVAIWNAALSLDAVTEIYNATYNNTGKVLDLNTDTGNYTSSANLQYWNRLGD